MEWGDTRREKKAVGGKWDAGKWGQRGMGTEQNKDVGRWGGTRNGARMRMGRTRGTRWNENGVE